MLTICEVSLHNADLYSTSCLQLTSVSASYTIHRLQVADKISKHVARVSSAVHTAKSLASALSLVIDRENGDVTFPEMAALGFMTYAVLSVFVYGTAGEKSGFQVGGHCRPETNIRSVKTCAVLLVFVFRALREMSDTGLQF